MAGRPSARGLAPWVSTRCRASEYLKCGQTWMPGSSPGMTIISSHSNIRSRMKGSTKQATAVGPPSDDAALFERGDLGGRQSEPVAVDLAVVLAELRRS